MTRVVCQTRWQADVALQPLLHAVPRKRLCIIPNGLPAWARAPVARTPHAQPVIGWAGSIYPRKRPGDLARAVQMMADLGTQVHFTGSIDHLDLLSEADRQLLLSQPHMFRLLGEADRATTLGRVASADVFCLPSADESFPLTVLEAAAQGVPMALSALPCYAGIWQHGVNALLSAPGDVPALARNLRTLLTDQALAGRLGQAGRDTALRYRQETQHAALTQVLLDALQDPLPPAAP
jgi:D-inositol-3-phosphate glycosyltransferase